MPTDLSTEPSLNRMSQWKRPAADAVDWYEYASPSFAIRSVRRTAAAFLQRSWTNPRPVIWMSGNDPIKA